MKAIVVSPTTNGERVAPIRGIPPNSSGINGTRRNMESEGVSAYLTKLKSLVPDMPRKRKLSKLEVIQRVIEYICYLQTTLEETSIHQTEITTNKLPRQPLQTIFNAATTTSLSTTTTISTTSPTCER